jgi:hypothetical protein
MRLPISAIKNLETLIFIGLYSIRTVLIQTNFVHIADWKPPEVIDDRSHGKFELVWTTTLNKYEENK